MLETFENIREKKNGFDFLEPKKDANSKEVPVKPKEEEKKIESKDTKEPSVVKPNPKEDDSSKKSKKSQKGSKRDIDASENKSVKDSKSAKEVAEVKSDATVDYGSDLGRANAALKAEFRSTEAEFEKFANESGLARGTIDTLLKLVKAKLVGKLVEARVKVKDLSWIVLYQLFKKHSSKERRYAGTRVLPIEKSYPAFLKELSVVMGSFEEIGHHIQRDIKKMQEFDSDSNLSDDQFYFASYLRNVQK